MCSLSSHDRAVSHVHLSLVHLVRGTLVYPMVAPGFREFDVHHQAFCMARGIREIHVGSRLHIQRTILPDTPQVPDTDVSGDVTLPKVSADASLPSVSGDVSLPDVSGDANLPGVGADVTLPSGDVDVDVPAVTGKVDLPSGDMSLPSVSGDVSLPSGEVSMPGMSGDAAVPGMAADVSLPSGSVDVTAPDVDIKTEDSSLTAGLAAAGAAAVGAVGAGLGSLAVKGDKPEVGVCTTWCQRLHVACAAGYLFSVLAVFYSVSLSRASFQQVIVRHRRYFSEFRRIQHV